MDRAERIALHSSAGNCACKTFMALAPFSGPNQDSARMARPAGRLPRANSQRLACCSSTVRLPSSKLRDGPDVRNTSRTGT